MGAGEQRITATRRQGRNYSIDAWLRALYRRQGARYVNTTISVLLVALAVPAAAAALISARHRGFAAPRTLFSVGVVVIALLLGAARVGWTTRRDIRAVRLWAGGVRDAATTERILTALFRLPRAPIWGRPAWAALPISSVGGALLFGLDENMKFDLGAGLLWAEGGMLLIFYAGAGAYFGIELALRPIREEMGALSRRQFASLRSFSITPKLLAGLGALVLGIGFFVTAALAQPRSNSTDLFLASLLMALIASGLGVLLALPIARSLVSPIEDLIDGTAAVARGDLDVEIPVTSGDELGELAVSFNEMLVGLRERETLRSHNAELVEELKASRARIVAAADAERRRAERDLHDGAQQHLVLLRLKLGTAERRLAAEPAAAGSVYADLRSDLDRAMDDLRDLAHGIYPVSLENDGLPGALAEAVDRAAIQAQLDCDGARRYRPELEAAVYFCCLEALQNAAKHAGEGATASVQLTEHDGELHFAITDDGAGFDAAGAGQSSGLQNMTDRIGALGGWVAVESAVGAGTTVNGSVPVEE